MELALHTLANNAIAVVATTVFFVGCGGSRPTLEEIVEAAGELPGTRNSSHPELRAALRALETTDGLPSDLHVRSVTPGENGAVVLKQAIPFDENFASVSEQVETVFFDLLDDPLPQWHRKAQQLVREHYETLAAADAASDMRSCNFSVDFERGYFNDTHFLDATAMACRLQLISAALATESGNLGDAIDEFVRAYRWCDRLGEVPMLEAQLQAASLRGNAAIVLSLIATDQRATQADLKRLSVAMGHSLDTWPSERKMLVGERALAMHAYEMIRKGFIELVVTMDERKVLRQEKILEKLREADEAIIDDDEFQYLDYMAAVIAIADRPYHLRVSELRELDRQLAISNGGRYAWLANRAFADGLTAAQAQLARSHGELIGWYVALCEASGDGLEAASVNPFNGETIVVERLGNRIIARLADPKLPDPSVRLPDAPSAVTR